MTLGERIAWIRKKRGWLQRQLADAVGVHPKHVSRWETDTYKPTFMMQQRIAKALQVPVLFPDEKLSSLDPDTDLARHIQMLLELDPWAQAIVGQVIQAFVTQQRVVPRQTRPGRRL